MKIAELRIGNLIQRRNTGHELLSMVMSEIEGISDQWVTIRVDIQTLEFISNGTKAWEFRSIPLTGDELVRLGFKHLVGGEIKNLSNFEEIWHNGNGYFIERDLNTFIIYQHTDEDTYNQIKWLHTIHELENLYYALEEKELEYIVEPIVKEKITKITNVNCKECNEVSSIKITKVYDEDFSDGIQISINKCTNCGYQIDIDKIYDKL